MKLSKIISIFILFVFLTFQAHFKINGANLETLTQSDLEKILTEQVPALIDDIKSNPDFYNIAKQINECCIGKEFICPKLENNNRLNYDNCAVMFPLINKNEVLGFFHISYVNNKYMCQFVTDFAPKLNEIIKSSSGNLALFSKGLDMYAISENNELYPLFQIQKAPRINYSDVQDEKNIINKLIISPKYYLSGKQIKIFSDSIQPGCSYTLKNVYSELYLSKNSNLLPFLHQSSSNIGSEPIQLQFKFFLFEGSEDEDNAYYYIIPADNEQIVLDVNNAKNANGTKIKVFKRNDAYIQAQLFKFICNNDGSYRIVPKLSDNKVIEVAGPSKNDGADIQLWDYIGADNQKWILTRISK